MKTIETGVLNYGRGRITLGCLGLALAVCGLATQTRADGVNPYTGLWVGSVGLQTVNEVSVPLDENNVAQAPDPEKPTVTGDRADIRLILHVNPAGQVCLLKDIAIINRNPSGSSSATAADIAAAGSAESSLSLVTDPSLYAEYPMQKATRYSSVVFDFGDARATQVLDALVDNVVAVAKAKVESLPASAIDTAAERNLIVEEIVALVVDNKSGINTSTGNDDVAVSYQAFLDSVKGQVEAIAASATLSSGAAKIWMTTATQLAQRSAFGDTRAEAFVRAVQAAGKANAYADAWNTAANLADTDNSVNRMLSGKDTGDALIAAAGYAASNATATVENLRALPSSSNLVACALSMKWSDKDTRLMDAAMSMFTGIIAAAQEARANGEIVAVIQENALAAGQAVLLEALATYPLNLDSPTAGYTAFVNSDDYKAVPAAAARAAAAAALTERIENALTYTQRLASVAKAAAMNALQATYTAAARCKRNELLMGGSFGLGNGDPRFALDVPTGDVLGAAGLTGQIILPANHPTNPFRHRRHPDHTTGFDITRNIRLDFDAEDETGTIPSVTRGVSRVEGMYREEVLGLHKALGPNQDIGLRTEGRFLLNRISTIGTLNGK